MNDNLNGIFAQQGWQCPICKRVYSPFTQMCYYCGQIDTISQSDVTINEFNTIKCCKKSFAEAEQTLEELKLNQTIE